MVKIGDMKNKAASYTNQMKDFQGFLEDLAKTGKGGIDEVMNADLVNDIGYAIMSAGENGVKQKSTGIYSIGDSIDMWYQNGMLNYTIYDRRVGR